MDIPTHEIVTEVVNEHLAAGDQAALQAQLTQLHPAEVSNIIESLPPPEREQLWKAVPEEMAGEVLAHLGEVARTGLVEALLPEELVVAARSMDTPELAEVIGELSQDLGEAVLESLAPDERVRLEQTLAFPEHSAGRLMDTTFVAIRANVALEVVLRYLRRRKALPEHTDGLMVIDREGIYLGKLQVSTLLTRDPSLAVSEVMNANADWVRADTAQSEVARLFERRDLVSVAVVDDSGKLRGRITVDQAIDIMQAQAAEQMLHMAGLREEEDLFAPVFPSAQRRAIWLGINLVTAFLASWVIGLFEQTLAQVVALAVLMPIVASMGGIAGSQTLTLAIRGLALGQISASNTRWLVLKEFAVGLLNGLIWSLVVGIIATAWFKMPMIGVIIAIAIIINLVVAVLCGVAVPLALRRFGIDPAVSGAVVLTTITDVVGFISFLGLATLFLL